MNPALHTLMLLTVVHSWTRACFPSDDLYVCLWPVLQLISLLSVKTGRLAASLKPLEVKQNTYMQLCRTIAI